MGLLNWGNALSEAGKSMQTMGLEGVKSVLEQDKIRLADELASKREETSDIRRQGFEKENIGLRTKAALEQKQGEFDILNKPENVAADVARQNKILTGTLQARLDDLSIMESKRLGLATDDAVARANRIKADEDARVLRISTDPSMLKALTTVAAAQETPSVRAANLASAALSVVKTDHERQLATGRKELSEAQDSKDPVRIKAAKAKLDGLTYDSTAERAEITALSSLVKTSEQLIANLNTSYATAMTAEAKGIIKGRIDTENATFQALRDQAMKKLNIEIKPPPPPPATTGWDDTTKKVYRNGTYIGTASNSAEAKKLIDKNAIDSKD